MNELGIGVVGAGQAAAFHLTAVGRHPGARLIGVCDVDESRAHDAARSQPSECRWTSSLDEMLTWPEIEAVIVCTPSATHADIGRSAIGAGKHVLVEKPLGLNLDSVDLLIDTASRAGVVLMPGHTHRFYDYGLSIRAAIPERVGEPQYARLTLLAGWIWGGWSSWVLDPGRSGGHVVHNGVHGLDLVTWWMDDEPVEVAAVGQKATSAALQIWDYFEVAVRYRRGGAAVIEVSRGHRPRAAIERGALVAGTRGILTIPRGGWGGEMSTEAGSSPLGFDAQSGFDREVAAFVEAVTAGKPPPVSGADGRRALAMAIAAEEAILSGRAVTLQ